MFGLVISDVPPVHPAVMGTCIAGNQRRPGVVLATSASCVPWLSKLVCPDSWQPVQPMAKNETFDLKLVSKFINIVA